MKLRFLFLSIFLFLCILNNYAQDYELWGMTNDGGDNAEGVIFKTDINGENQSVSYSFNSGTNAHNPYGSLTQTANGKLYGMTSVGGANNLGVLFEFDISTCQYEAKIDFAGSSNGASPMGDLTLASNGKLYGMTNKGGTSDLGIIFEYDTSTEVLTKMIDFAGASNGSAPMSSLMQASNTKIYGMTSGGGTNSKGVFFEYIIETNTLTVLVHFNGTNGQMPIGSLMQASNGKLYGSTGGGGTHSLGVLFEYDPSTNIFVKKIDLTDASQGSSPVGTLVEADNDKLYGVTFSGGANDEGVLFEYNITTNTYSKKQDFEQNTSGSEPFSSPIKASNGILYGTTQNGGYDDKGVLYTYTPSTNTLEVNAPPTIGNRKIGAVYEAADGHLYGMTTGDSSADILYQYNISANTTNSLHIFSSYGFNPQAGLIQASNGKLYGFLSEEQQGYGGVLFEFNPATQAYVKKINFGTLCNPGLSPLCTLIEASNGKLYGTTSFGGTNNDGTIFEYSPSTNTLVSLFSFNDDLDGKNPYTSLVQANNDKLYGVTYSGGANGTGVLFEYDLNTQTFLKKMDFDVQVEGKYKVGNPLTEANKEEKTDNYGNSPLGSLIQANDGKLYGMTVYGGIYNGGVLYEYDINASTYTALFNFSGSSTGTDPPGALIQASNGKLYGMTEYGGDNNMGVVFEYNITTSSFTKLVDFDGTDKGKRPVGSLIEASTGKLYGMTAYGGDSNYGVVFEYIISSASFTKKLDFDYTNGKSPMYSSLIKVASSTHTWSGTTDNDWSTSSNWLNESIPQSSNEVVIPAGLTNYPNITSGVSCSELTIRSNASGDGSLKGQGNLTVSGDIIIERYISPFSSSSNGWHFLSSPVADFTIAGSNFEPGSGIDDLYQWGESSYMWLNYYDSNFPETEMEVGKGYLVAYSSSDLKEFNGDLNTGNLVKNLSYTVGKGEGWNLLGNPYTSAIDWDLLTMGDVHGSVYIVKPDDGSYLVYNGSTGDITNGEIPVNQGFFVKANSNGQTLSISTAAQVHSSNNFNKEAQEINETLKVYLKGNQSENSTYFQLRADASLGFDSQIDAYKLFGFGDSPQVYSDIDNTKYSINCLPYSSETISVPLSIKINTNEELEFNFSGIESFNASMKIYLEDLIEKKIIDIRSEPIYEFTALASDAPNRFLLHFSGATAVEELVKTQSPHVYSAQGTIYILSNSISDANIFVYNLNGKLLGKDRLNGENLKSLNLKLVSGIYIVSLKSERSVWNYKVYLK